MNYEKMMNLIVHGEYLHAQKQGGIEQSEKTELLKGRRVAIVS
jgi:hypothetical protein